MKVTFIGLGIMGSRMAKNLLQNNIELTVYNRSESAMRQLEKAGARAAATAQEAVREADIVFTMLSSPEVVAEVAWSDSGFLKSMKAKSLWIDCSTVNPSFSRQSAQIASQYRVRFADIPVAGTKLPAEKGELLFLAGGAKEDIARTEPLLMFMGKKVMHIGETGMGTSFKMLVNSMLAQSMLGFAETVLLGQKMGISKDFLLNTLPNLPVCAPFIKAKAEMIKKGNYEVQFPLQLMYKDLHLVTLSAYEKNQPVYLANLVKELFSAAKQSGLGTKDFSAVFEFLDMN